MFLNRPYPLNIRHQIGTQTVLFQSLLQHRKTDFLKFRSRFNTYARYEVDEDGSCSCIEVGQNGVEIDLHHFLKMLHLSHIPQLPQTFIPQFMNTSLVTFDLIASRQNLKTLSKFLLIIPNFLINLQYPQSMLSDLDRLIHLINIQKQHPQFDRHNRMRNSLSFFIDLKEMQWFFEMSYRLFTSISLDVTQCQVVVAFRRFLVTNSAYFKNVHQWTFGEGYGIFILA